jgi:hypothetical protein
MGHAFGVLKQVLQYVRLDMPHHRHHNQAGLALDIYFRPHFHVGVLFVPRILVARYR